MADRNDLPLSEDASTRLVPWIVGVMAYLAALAFAAALMLSNIASEWSQGLEGSLTVQVPVAEGDKADVTDARILSAVRILLKTEGVESARPIPLAEIAEMLEPWLGTGAGTSELPLPQVHRRFLASLRFPYRRLASQRLCSAFSFAKASIWSTLAPRYPFAKGCKTSINPIIQSPFSLAQKIRFLLILL